jgi:hypothetical protein
MPVSTRPGAIASAPQSDHAEATAQVAGLVIAAPSPGHCAKCGTGSPNVK